ncbi:hypothetical protein NST33_17680 [Paenibacillus sp. FSL L8-0435]|uniref:hypothetical protein n=1 Tax=Paenibacillus sp. FSL L8-0435 TaxID=2954618 RepID=UPI0030DA8458
MKLYRVDNTFTGYGLNSYLVSAATEQEAIKMAGLRLKEYALNNNFAINETMYKHVGIPVRRIHEHIDTPSYLSHFTAKCLSEDIALEQVIKI